MEIAYECPGVMFVDDVKRTIYLKQLDEQMELDYAKYLADEIIPKIEMSRDWTVFELLAYA